MELSLERREEGGWTVIHVAGELDLNTAPALGDELTEVSALPKVAVELTDVAFMDSSAIGILVSALNRAREAGGDVVLVGVNGSPGKALSLTGLDQVFRMVPTTASLEP